MISRGCGFWSPTMLDKRPQYEPVAWWFTRKKIGRGLGDRYQPPEELPPQLLALLADLSEKPSSAVRPEVEKLIGDVCSQ
jgi:hypothetical protein